ncbi:MAG: hypothetical protein ACI9X4_001095 [Glaciecola sp.]|jgi:hypothetical protein
MKVTLSVLALALCLPLVNAQSNSSAKASDPTSTATSHNLGDLPPEIGVTYCDGVPGILNTGSIHARGSVVAADNMVLLSVQDITANSLGYFIVGEAREYIPNPAGSQGDLCIGGAIGRLHGLNGFGQILNSGPNGFYELWIDLTALPLNPNRMVVAGETWRFQSWYRMPGQPVADNSDSDFTNAIEIQFQ